MSDIGILINDPVSLIAIAPARKSRLASGRNSRRAAVAASSHHGALLGASVGFFLWLIGWMVGEGRILA
jgi:hypothetical protein